MKNSELLTTAIQAAMQAGDILRRGFGTSFNITSKPGKHNLVTDYDKLAEACIEAILLKRFPTHGFLGEEQGYLRRGDTLWIVDPLDGTVNFAHGIPHFSVSIAVAVEQQVVAGCVYQPITQELFWAEAGQGAYLNGAQLRVTTQATLDQAFLATGFPYNVDENPLHCIETFANIIRQGVPIRRLGSAAIDLSYVAAGRFDAYWEVVLQPWDFAAGKLLVEEAGGRVSRYDDQPYDLLSANPILASNGLLHRLMQQTLKEGV